jgi:peptide/nickel transport system ATP-binding protein
VTPEAPAVSIRGLRVAAHDGLSIVDDASFDLAPGEILGVVGESGSGKTTLGLALLHHCRRGLAIAAGSVVVGGRDLAAQSPEELRRLRGGLMCYVPQDPATALNPALRIRTQLREALGARASDEAALDALLDEVKLPTKAGILDAFPHQLSGGQAQRVAIAMAFANRPRLIVMDEPTTGLDVTTQAHVLATIRRLCESYRVAAIYVSHDIAVVASLAQRVAVVYAGRIVEIGPTARVLREPGHPYTRALIRAVPDIDDDAVVSGIPGQSPDNGAQADRCAFAPRCALAIPPCRREVPALAPTEAGHMVRCLRAGERDAERRPEAAAPFDDVASRAIVLSANSLKAWHGRSEILHGVTLEVRAGECVGLVGESGSGKTTLARCLAGLHEAAEGFMSYRGAPLPAGPGRRSPDMLRRIQYVFQNPYGSLNPRRSVGASLAAPLRRFERLSWADARRRVLAALEQVSLPASAADRLPHQMSGGQRQRAAIARALIVDPDCLICDEITSALDVSVQAVITELLARLQRERGLSLLFVTHNLAVVRGLAQRVAVMQQGRIVEIGPTAQVLGAPQAAETRRLMQDTPRFSRLAAPARLSLALEG